MLIVLVELGGLKAALVTIAVTTSRGELILRDFGNISRSLNEYEATLELLTSQTKLVGV